MSENLTQQLPEDLLRQILASINSLGGPMTALEERVDRRLQETRPIWEAVLARLDKLEERMAALETRMAALETRMDGLETRMDGLEARMSSLEKRMDNLELDTRAGFRRVERVMGDAAKYLLEVQS
jgi:chromosome segregation ATPase